MKKKIIITTLVLFVSFLLSTAAYRCTSDPLFFSAAITLGTTFYHFAMRLTVGALIDAKFHNRMDYTKAWFQEKRFEPRLYRMLQVKRWKKYLPTLSPENFRFHKHNVAALIQTTCQSELVHEIIMVLSFVPVSFTIWLGGFEIFLVTSCLAFLFDGSFVVLQRYNRPRMVCYMEKQSDTTAQSVLS